jgi:hypothetical protein
MAEPKSTSVAVRTCSTHGAHSDWSFRKPHGSHKTGGWRCRPCDRERYEASKVKPWRISARNKAQAKDAAARKGARERYRESVYAALLEAYGVEVAAFYKAAIVETPPAERSQSVTVKRVVREFVAQAYPRLTPGNVQRVILMNRIAQRPLINIGWSCAQCFVESTEPCFFDIDHIVPCSETGRRTYGDMTNLQLLCPNCHRCKTLGLKSWFELSDVVAA